MQFLWPYACLALTSVVYILRVALKAWHRQQMISKNGCLPIPHWPSQELFAKDYDREQTNAFRNGKLNDWAMHQYEKCGSATFRIQSLNEDIVMSKDPVIYQKIATDLEDWERENRRAGKPFLGVNSGISNTNGELYKRARNLVHPLFKRTEIDDLEGFSNVVDSLINLIPKDGSTIDMQTLSRRLFQDTSTEFVFGHSIGSLHKPEGEQFIATYNRALAEAGKRIRAGTGIVSRIRKMFGSWDKKWLADIKIIHDWVDDCIARHRRAVNPNREKNKHYCLINAMSEDITDPVDLRFQLLSVFSLARETPAMAFSNTLWALARNPSIWSDLRKEVLQLHDGDLLDAGRLRSMTSFRHTILEGMRLHSPVTRNRRIAARDTILPHGGGLDGTQPCFVSKGTIVWADKYPATRDPSIWGDDVELFRPSRFEGRKLGWEFAPFSLGPRACPAREQVLLQCTYLLARLVREFEEIENRDPCLDFVEQAVMCWENKNGCKVAFYHKSSG